MIDSNSSTARTCPQRPPARSVVLFLAVAALLLGADLLTKKIAFEKLATVEPGGVVLAHDYRAIDGWLHFTAVVNRGAVFGAAQGRRYLFIAVSFIAIGYLLFLLATSGRRYVYQIVLAMILAGVLGNLYDRVALGYVRDMIYALPKFHLWPWVFNVADMLLCVGVPLIVLLSLRTPQAPAPSEKK